jgi:hypothetical protein
MSNSKPKPITVNIKGDYPETRKVTPQFTSDGRTILAMEKTTETKVGWTIDITDSISYDIKGKRIIDVIRGDRYPIKYSPEDKEKLVKKTIFPFLSLDHIKEFADMEVFKKAVSGVKEQLAKLTPLIWIILILVIISLIMGAVNIYMANGITNAVGKIPIPTPAPSAPPHV